MFKPVFYSNNLDPYIDITKQLYRKHSKLIRWRHVPESIMDLGIGDGRMSKEVVLPMVPEDVIEYVGADISKTMLSSAKTTMNHKKFKTIEFDASTKNLPDDLKNRFHHIFSNYLFHHIQDTRQLLKNILEMLKPGGQLIFHAFGKTAVDEAYDILDRGKWVKYNNRKSISPFYECENPKQEYENVIRSVGFVDCHIYAENYVPRFLKQSFEELRIAVNTRLPFVEEEDREEYLKDYVEACKHSSIVKRLVDEQSGEEFYEVTLNIISGVISKPL